MKKTCDIISSLTQGIDKVFAYDNIAIAVLVLCLIYAGVWISKLLNQLFQVKDVLSQLNISIAILNERIDHHSEEDHDKDVRYNK